MCYPLKYRAYGYLFGVRQVASSGRWHALGTRAGSAGYVLDKIGDADSQEAMQAKLDAWAKRNGCRPVNMPAQQPQRQEVLGI